MAYCKEKGPQANVGFLTRVNVVSGIQGILSHAPPTNVCYAPS